MAEFVLVCIAWPLRQLRHPPGQRHRLSPAGRHLRPLPPPARRPRPDGFRGSDSHGTPVTVKAEVGQSNLEFMSTTTPASSSCSAAGHQLRSVHQHPHREPRQVPRISSPVCWKTVILSSQGDAANVLAGGGQILPDRYVEGTCPNCGYTGARGDQCDNCNTLSRAPRSHQPAQQTGQHFAGVARHGAFLPRSAGHRRGFVVGLDP